MTRNEGKVKGHLVSGWEMTAYRSFQKKEVRLHIKSRDHGRMGKPIELGKGS